MLLGKIVVKDDCICLQSARNANLYYPLDGNSWLATDFRETFNNAGMHDVGRTLHRVNGVFYMGNKPDA